MIAVTSGDSSKSDEVVNPSVKVDDAVLTNLGEQLDKVLATLTLKDAPEEKSVDRARELLNAYLLINEPEFERVMEFRDRGWKNKEQGDAFFKAQREKADNASNEEEHRFYAMMIEIAEEMEKATGALTPVAASKRPVKVLDICMAPGGYSAAVLKLHQTAQVYGVTLPTSAGGHEVLLPTTKLMGLVSADVTMLASEFLKDTNRNIPANYPDKFISSRPFVSHKMDIVFCDGIVLRSHQRPSYRQETEATRLSTAQLILGMQRLAQGGTLIMLLHKIDSWTAASILYTFSKFAKVDTFKPVRKHNTRSSFYMIAKEVDIHSPFAKAAVAERKADWFKATFGGEDGTGENKAEPEETVVLAMLDKFGPTLMRMGRSVWKIQADALSKTSYACA